MAGLLFRFAPGMDTVAAAIGIVGFALAMDAAVVAPIFERSCARFAGIVGLWLPMVSIFLAVLVAGRGAQ